MNALIWNCGSSSLTFKVFDIGDSMQELAAGKAHRVGVKGTKSSHIEFGCGDVMHSEEAHLPDHRHAAELALGMIRDNGVRIDIVGNRFVHGGDYFQESCYVDADVLAKLRSSISLAPIHNPNSLSVIEKTRELLPETPQYVSIDSAFHHTLPARAARYALSQQVARRYHYRVYGFHGLSYAYVAEEAPVVLGRAQERLDMVVCHLGTGGASVAALRNGASLDTSMGFSPVSGLVMSTRSGDIDPMVAVYLMESFEFSAQDVLTLLSKRSGLLGLSGASSDIRDLEQSLDSQRAERAFQIYIHRLRQYIGSFITALGGIDALVFTDDIGVSNPQVREAACQDLGLFGIELDKPKNRDTYQGAELLSSPESDVAIATIPTEEELMIARYGQRLVKEDTHACSH
jgi:acetate kinase